MTTFKLFIHDIYALSKHENKFTYREHRVEDVEIFGVIRSLRRDFGSMAYYDIDDGTGMITCWCPKSDSKMAEMDAARESIRKGPYDLDCDIDDVFDNLKEEERLCKFCKCGDLLQVRGIIKEYNGRRYVDSLFYSKVIGNGYYVSNVMTNHIKDQLRLYANVYDCSPVMMS